MADAEKTDQLRGQLKAALEFRERDLVDRPEWGSVDFSAAEGDLERAFKVLTDLSLMPLENLTDGAVSTIVSNLSAFTETLKKVDSFSIEGGNPAQMRDGLVTEVHQRTDDLYGAASQWIPYLAYLRGDVEKNIQALTKGVEKARKLTEDAAGEIEEKHDEIDRIVTAAREASAAAGAAVFTKDFDGEADKLGDRAKIWLNATAAFGVVTTVLAVAAFFVVQSDLDTGEIVQVSAARLAVLAIFFTATIWCGRLYKALLHQSAINRHRALSLQTFQAFSHAAADDITKDAVLLEATRAIFGNVPTGLIDTSSVSTPQGMQVVEIAKHLNSPG